MDLGTLGVWLPEPERMSINLLELRAIQLGLQHFQEELHGKTVALCYLCSDNTTALAHMHPKSGRHSLQTADIFGQGDSAVEQG